MTNFSIEVKIKTIHFVCKAQEMTNGTSRKLIDKKHWQLTKTEANEREGTKQQEFCRYKLSLLIDISPNGNQCTARLFDGPEQSLEICLPQICTVTPNSMYAFCVTETRDRCSCLPMSIDDAQLPI